jgi:hypothetical protein
MKRRCLWMLGLALIVGCGGGGDEVPPPAGAPTAQTAQVAVTVIDTQGRFVAGATLTSSAGSATTDASGRATVAVATGGEAALRVDKDGHAEQVKVLDLPAGTTSAGLVAMLIEREAALQIAAIEGGGSASGRHGVKVTFPPAALIDAAGNAATGTVQITMTPVDVGDELVVGAFPGLFEGLPGGGGARTAIVSYGTAELVPQQNGRRLQLAAGKSAEIELPLYVTKHPDGSQVRAGDTVPLWSLDASTGLWRQEGQGTVVASAASPTGLVLRAQVTHFSWWNADTPSQRGEVNLTVNVPGVSVPAGTLATVTGTVVAGSGPASVATAALPIGTARQLRLPAGATVRLQAVASFADQHCSGSAVISVPAGGTAALVIDLTCVTVPVPRIVRPAGPLATNSSAPVSFQIVVDGPHPDELELFANGTRIARFPAQFFYTGLWDTAPFAEGSYTLVARTTFNGIVRDGAPVVVTVDRTPPTATAIAPALSVEVDRNTTFTVDFDETVRAFAFALTDVVKLAVTPAGSSTPLEMPITATLDAAGQRLTVTTNAVLPPGVASLSWGGLRDAAGNAVAGVVAATWSVNAATQLGNDFPVDHFNTLALAVDAGGVPHVVRRLPDEGHLQAMRFDGQDFVPLGPPINDRTPGDLFAFAIDGAGTLFVAFEQNESSGTNIEVVVKRFDGAAWQTLGAPFAVGRSTSANPALAIDAAGRPVLTFIGGGNSFVAVGHRFVSGTWTSLGTIAQPVFPAGRLPGSVKLAIDGAGRPVVAFLRGIFGSNAASLEAAVHDGSAWVALGGVIDAVSDATDRISPPALAIAPDGRPWLAWDGSGGAVVKLARFDGTAFVALPIDPPLGTFNGVVGLAFVGGDAVIAGAQFSPLRVSRLRSGVWEAPIAVAPPGALNDVTLLPAGDALVIGMVGDSVSARVTRLRLP